VSALVDHRGTSAPVRPPRFSALVVVADPQWRADVVAAVTALGSEVVVEAASAAEARSRVRLAPPRELAVLQLSLPDGSGVALLAELRESGWRRAVVLATDPDPFSVRAALAAGVRGFVVTGPPTGPGSLAAPRPLPPGADGLSAREVQVLEHVAQGRSNRDIGSALQLSALTVKSHLARIARKLGTGDRAEMVAVAMRAGLIS